MAAHKPIRVQNRWEREMKQIGEFLGDMARKGMRHGRTLKECQDIRDRARRMLQHYTQCMQDRKITRLKRYRRTPTEEKRTCAVCHEDISTGVKTWCDHVYHKACIVRWIQSRLTSSCPECRNHIVPDGAWLNDSDEE